MLDLEISIVNNNNCKILEECLLSIFENTKGIEFIVSVVDNASTDGSVKMLKEKFPQVNLIENKIKKGFSANHNQVLKKSQAKYILLLNDDTKVLGDSFFKMVKFMDTHPEVGIAGCKVLNLDGTLQYSARKFPSKSIKMLLAGFFHNTFLGKLFPENPFTKEYLLIDWDHSEAKEVDWVSGCCMMIRKEVLDKIGYLDERFVMFVEDVDICYRVWKSGYKVYYFPDAKIIHYGGVSTSREPLKMIIEHHKSMYKFYKKHYLVRGRLKWIIIAGLFLRCSISITQNILGIIQLKWKKKKV
jgi:GT2 family glycosyltransferase